MKVMVVSNAASGSSDSEDLQDILGELGALGDVISVQPSSLETFDEEVQKAARDADLVVSAGGDGTLNCVVNALRDRFDDLAFGLVPMGTGNDLARTLGLPEDPLDAARALVTGRERHVDVGRASGPGVTRLFVNACMGGFPVLVNRAIDEDSKKLFGPLAFWVGGIKAARDLERWSITVNGEPVEDVVAVGVGNGRTCGGGVEVWPNAALDDGVLDACAMPAANVTDAVNLATKVRNGEHQDLDGVVTLALERVEIEAEPALEFNVDGDLIDLKTPATFALVGRLRLRAPGSAGSTSH